MSESTELKKDDTIDALNEKIESKNRRIKHLEETEEYFRSRDNELCIERSNISSKCHNAVSSFQIEAKRYKLLTRNIKNLRLEYEHVNSREFSTKLLMLLEHYNDEIHDEMTKENDITLLRIYKSLYSF